jgi:hypothetical protein
LNATECALDLVDAVIYADLFDCAVTLDELWRFSRVRISRDELAQCLKRPEWRAVVHERDGYYCLRGREPLVSRREARQARARELRRSARRVARWLQHVPFARGVLLTGSVAAADADPEADVDMLVLVARERLALVFALLGPLSRLTSRRFFCPNYYLSEAHLALARRSHYVARELAQALALTASARAVLDANRWVGEYLPNASPLEDPVAPLPAGRMLQRLLEAPLRGRLGDRLEEVAQRLALARLRHHHDLAHRPVPSDVEERLRAGVELRFHGSAEHTIEERYETRRVEVGRMLEAAGVGAVGG